MRIRKPKPKTNKNNQVYAYCQLCHKEYLAQYWDEELDWYIYLNHKHQCEFEIEPQLEQQNESK